MAMIDDETQRTLWNWMMQGTVSKESFKKLIDDGKLKAGNERKQMVTYAQLRSWGVAKDD